MEVSGPALAALESLTPSQLSFLTHLPKAELHAHLHGSISLLTLRELSRQYLDELDSTADNDDEVLAGIKKFEQGVELNEIGDFFGLFPAIYKLISTPQRLAYATKSVLHDFLDGYPPQCTYLELRSTPRQTPHLTHSQYISTLLSEIERYPPSAASYILSLDRRMSPPLASSLVDLAISFKQAGRRIVGVDLCGDPLAGDPEVFKQMFGRAREAGLGVTVHIAETERNTEEDTRGLIECGPDRLGHGTFLSEETLQGVKLRRTCVEICLSSNLLCKTVPSLSSHHIKWYLEHKHPIAICTDDALPFRTSLLGEYALLMARPPLGLGLVESEVGEVAKMGFGSRFGVGSEVGRMGEVTN